jgi:hypothetical protein
MLIQRRKFLKLSALGVGVTSARSLLTGLPESFFQDPRQALAAADRSTRNGVVSNPQFLLFASSDQGDPLNCNVPGSYEDANIYHPPSPLFAATPLNLGGSVIRGAKTWTQLPADTLTRTCFFHHATNTGIHTDEGKVLGLAGTTTDKDTLVSTICTKTADALQTIQTAPISLAGMNLSYQGQPVSQTDPASLVEIYKLYDLGPTGLTAMRDQSLDKLHNWLKNNGTPAQRNYIDSYVLNQQQARQVPADLLNVLAGIQSNTVQDQVKAAIILFKMRITPAAAIIMPFGGDNHGDPGLAQEIGDYDGNNPQTWQSKAMGGKTGCAALADMVGQLSAAGMADQVTFALLNVFGRTMGQNSQAGRGHNGGHHVSLLIGSKVRGGVVGGVQKLANPDDDGAALGIDPASGVGSAGGSIPVDQTMSAFGKTLIRAVGLAQTDADAMITAGKTVQAAITT